MTDAATKYYALFLKHFPYGLTCWLCGEAPYSERHHAYGRSDKVVRIELKGTVIEVIAYKLLLAACGRCHRILERNKTKHFKDGAAEIAIGKRAHLL